MLSIFDKGSPTSCPSRFNLAAYVLSYANTLSDKTALSILELAGSKDWTYRKLKETVLTTAGGFLDRGLKPQDRILLRLDNTVEFPIAFLAAISVDIKPVPLSAQLTNQEIVLLADIVSAKAVCLDPALSFPPALDIETITIDELRLMQMKEPANFSMGSPNRLAYIVFTSGTSGSPKAVMHAHRAVWARKMMINDWYGLRPDDRMLHAGAFNWTYTLGTGLLDPWSKGATSLIPDRNITLDQLPHLIKKHKATIFAAVPGVYRKFLSSGNLPVFSSLRHGLSAGEKLSENLRHTWQMQTKTNIYEAFGMSECSTFISASPQFPADLNTIGRPQNGRRVAIVSPDQPHPPLELGQTGMIAIDRSDQGLMLGYINGEKEPKSKRALNSTWFLTGDLGKMNKNGSITYMGRDDDLITAGGYRVSPIEVETQLQLYPEITSVAVSQIEIKKDTFVIAAFYTAKTEIKKDVLKEFSQNHLARYKQPRVYIYCDLLPTGPNGKILRKALSSLKKVDSGGS